LSTNSTGCTFCRIIRGEEKAYKVFEDDFSIVFLDIHPLFHGHCLVVPKEHYETLADLPDESIERIFKNAKLVSQAVEVALKADGSFIGINNKVSQSVPHLHIHIIPRRKGDGLKGFFWPRTRYKDEKELLEIQSMIKTSIEKIVRGEV